MAPALRVRPVDAGLTLVELTVVLLLLVILCAVSIPPLLVGLDDLRARSAARYVAGQLYRARSEAVKRSVFVAWRFQPDGDDFRFGAFADGNANGVRTVDITRGVDPRLLPDVRLSQHMPGTRFGIAAGVPLIDGGTGEDPIRLSSGSLLSFNPNGSATSGSLYVRGERGAQYAVRTFGATGRTRVYRYLGRGGGWKPLL